MGEGVCDKYGYIVNVYLSWSLRHSGNLLLLVVRCL